MKIRTQFFLSFFLKTAGQKAVGNMHLAFPVLFKLPKQILSWIDLYLAQFLENWFLGETNYYYQNIIIKGIPLSLEDALVR